MEFRTGRLPLLLVALVALSGCHMVTPGGEFSGVPDTTVGDWRYPLGTLSTDGTIRLRRETGW